MRRRKKIINESGLKTVLAEVESNLIWLQSLASIDSVPLRTRHADTIAKVKDLCEAGLVTHILDLRKKHGLTCDDIWERCKHNDDLAGEAEFYVEDDDGEERYHEGHGVDYRLTINVTDQRTLVTTHVVGEADDFDGVRTDETSFDTRYSTTDSILRRSQISQLAAISRVLHVGIYLEEGE